MKLICLTIKPWDNTKTNKISPDEKKNIQNKKQSYINDSTQYNKSHDYSVYSNLYSFGCLTFVII